MLKTEEFFLNMGPQHPSTHGVLRLVLKLDGEVIKEATPVIGYLHRGIEKIAENRIYYSFVPYTDRLDYVSSMINNWAYCLAVERLLGIKPPHRGERIRVLIGELQRIASHLLWYGTFALDLGATTPFIYAFHEREKILDLFEMLCGARLTYNFYRIGGIAHDLPSGFLERARVFIQGLKKRMQEMEDILTENVIFLNRTKGIGVIPSDLAIGYGATGPVLRASGVKWDIRKDEPYSIYPELDFDIPTGDNGDCWDRYRVRLNEIIQSIRIIEQLLDKEEEEEKRCQKTGSKKPAVRLDDLTYYVKPPKGEVYSRIESPRGELGFYIVSDGSERPYRLKIRSPAFSNLSLIEEILKEVKVADVVAIVGSIDICLGEIDR